MARGTAFNNDEIVAVATATSSTDLLSKLKVLSAAGRASNDKAGTELALQAMRMWYARGKYKKMAEPILKARAAAVHQIEIKSGAMKKTIAATGAGKDVAIVGDGDDMLTKLYNESVVIQKILEEILTVEKERLQVQKDALALHTRPVTAA